MPPPPPPNIPDLGQLRRVFNDQRAACQMTFDELADASGLSRKGLLNISSGTSHGDLRTWLILARTWNIRLDDLLAPVWASTPAPGEEPRAHTDHH